MADVTWRMKGQYIKNCNCIATCPCDTTGFPYPDKGCVGMAGMHIAQGNFGNVKLDGLSWVVVYSWPGALHEGNGSVQPEFYVAQSVLLKGTGPVKFDFKNTHSSLAEVEHTNKGLQA